MHTTRTGAQECSTGQQAMGKDRPKLLGGSNGAVCHRCARRIRFAAAEQKRSKIVSPLLRYKAPSLFFLVSQVEISPAGRKTRFAPALASSRTVRTSQHAGHCAHISFGPAPALGIYSSSVMHAATMIHRPKRLLVCRQRWYR